MEIEAKFRVEEADVFAALLDGDTIGSFQLTHADAVEDQRNTYYDTSDRRLQAQRSGLRIRVVGVRRIVTLKGGGRVTGALHERDEWEVEIGADDRPEHWPSSEARERVLALIGAEPLQPILTIETRRRHIYASRQDDQVAELSLDEGVIRAGGREESFRELEIELSDGGTRADFTALVQLLRERFPLIPEERSKLARGLELLDEIGNKIH
jgi:inorganic triphosphatase YgiF